MDNQELFYLFRDLQVRLTDVESKICDRMDTLQRSIDSRIDPIEDTVKTHEHNFRIAKSVMSWGGLGAVLAASWEALSKVFNR